jgi:hypothetical protein
MSRLRSPSAVRYKLHVDRVTVLTSGRAASAVNNVGVECQEATSGRSETGGAITFIHQLEEPRPWNVDWRRKRAPHLGPVHFVGGVGCFVCAGGDSCESPRRRR